VPALPGHAAPGEDGPLRLVPIGALRPLSVGWAARRRDALTSPARAFADTVVESCRRNAPTATP
jgi:DNA-binding transcriptional LysR family regulator